MAQNVVISGSHSPAKIRSPWGVLGFSLITLGIYTLFWWYYINREMRDYGIVKQRDLGDSPTRSLLAFWFGGYTLYVLTVWTIVGTSMRIKRAQALAGVEQFDGIVAGLLWVFTLGIGGMIYTQSQLNKVWQAPGQTSGLLPSTFGPQSPAANPDLDRLRQLTDLRDSGSLSQEEFEVEKARLGIAPPTPSE